MNNKAQSEQLFTDLNNEQASVVEGGAKLYLYKATSIRSGADHGWWNGDDVYARINGDKTRKTEDVDTGETANFYKTKSFSNSARISLFDEDDGWLNNDDHLGSLTVYSTDKKGWHTRTVSGSGSTYDVTYYLY